MIAIGLLLLMLAIVSLLLRRSALFTWLASVASVVSLIGYAEVLLSGETQLYLLTLPQDLGSIALRVTPLAAFFGLIFSLGFPLGLLYGHFYLQEHPRKGGVAHQLYLGLMLLSMHLVLLLNHSLLFMIAWEMMSLASFFAILYERESAETVANALYYFVMMHIGAAFLIAGFGVMYLHSGSYGFGDAALFGWAKWLLLIGFAFKAGFFPFYSWLPKAHPAAPSHLSGLMSGLMIKTGVFGIIMVLSQAAWQPYELYILLLVALITAFNGVIHALAETNIKRILAYSSIENIGIIGIGLCLWLLGSAFANPQMAAFGFVGAMLHILFHSLFKPLMFYLSGNVLVGTHSLETDSLGGLSKRMPGTALLFLLGTAAITALPVMNGFVSEFTIFLGVLSGFNSVNLAGTLCAVVAGAVLAFVSALALIAFTKLYSIVFSGEPRSGNAEAAREVPAGMLLSPALLAGLCALTGVFGRVGLLFVAPLAQQYGLSRAIVSSLTTTLDSVGLILGILILISMVVYFIKHYVVKPSRQGTWGCGYQKPGSKMQYTGSAYINPLAYFLKPLLRQDKHKVKVEGYFPTQLKYTETVQDYVDTGIIQTLCKGLSRVYRLFDTIHNGRTNSYISYLLLALITLLIWVLGVSR